MDEVDVHARDFTRNPLFEGETPKFFTLNNSLHGVVHKIIIYFCSFSKTFVRRSGTEDTIILICVLTSAHLFSTHIFGHW